MISVTVPYPGASPEEVERGAILVVEEAVQGIEGAKEALRAALDDWPPDDVEAHLKRGYGPYWLSLDTETHARQAHLVREAEQAKRELTVDTRVDRYRDATEVTVYTADHAGLFSRMAGAMAVAGASIDAARIFTLANGMALDTFYVRNAQGGPFERPDHLARLAKAATAAVSARRTRGPRPTRVAKGSLPRASSSVGA